MILGLYFLSKKNISRKKSFTKIVSGELHPSELPDAWGHRSQAPNAFGLKPPSQLVIGYHWLAFLSQVKKNL